MRQKAILLQPARQLSAATATGVLQHFGDLTELTSIATADLAMRQKAILLQPARQLSAAIAACVLQRFGDLTELTRLPRHLDARKSFDTQQHRQQEVPNTLIGTESR